MSAPMKTHENGKTPNKQEEKKNNKQNLVKLVTARSSTLGKQGKQKKNETAKKSSHKKKKYLKAPFKYEWYVMCFRSHALLFYWHCYQTILYIIIYRIIIIECMYCMKN